MKTFKNLTVVLSFFLSVCGYGQSANKNESQETVTKIIRIKGPNGEEKIIKKEEVITKKNKVKFNPEDEDKTNQNFKYGEAEVSVQKSGSATSNIEAYTKVPDGRGYVVTLIDQKGSTITKVRALSDGYYLVHLGKNNNCLGRFDERKNLIIQMYDPKADKIISKKYKAN